MAIQSIMIASTFHINNAPGFDIFNDISKKVSQFAAQNKKEKSAVASARSKSFDLISQLSLEACQKINLSFTDFLKTLNEEILEYSENEAQSFFDEIKKHGVDIKLIEKIDSKLQNHFPDDIHYTNYHISVIGLVEQYIKLYRTLQRITETEITDEQVNRFWAKELKKKKYSSVGVSGQNALDFLEQYSK